MKEAACFGGLCVNWQLLDQAARLFFLRHPITPRLARPVAKSGNAPGSGVSDGESKGVNDSLIVSGCRLKQARPCPSQN
jgi:hypothetical protein